MDGEDRTGEDASWSEVKRARLPPFEARLYKARAGLDPAEAVRWWELDVFSGEAARAIADGRTLEQELERRRQRTEVARTERAQVTRDERTAIENARQHEALIAEAQAAFATTWDRGVLIRTIDVADGWVMYRIEPQVDGSWTVVGFSRGPAFEVGHQHDMRSAFHLLAQRFESRVLDVETIESRWVDPDSVLEAAREIASKCGAEFLMNDEQVDVTTRDGDHWLIPAHPDRWVGWTHRDDVQSVGRLYLVTDVRGRHVGVGFFDDVDAALEASRRQAAAVPRLEIVRHDDSGSHVTRLTADGAALFIVSGDAQTGIGENDLLDAVEAHAELNAISQRHVTEIWIHPSTGCTQRSIADRLVIDGDPTPDEELPWPEELEWYADYLLPAGVEIGGLFINGCRWCRVVAEGQVLPPMLSLGTDAVPCPSPDAVWASLSLIQWASMVSGTSTFVVGSAGQHAHVWVDDIDGSEIVVQARRGGEDQRLQAIADWVAYLDSEMHVDVAMLVVHAVVTGATSRTEDRFTDGGSETLECTIDCTVDASELSRFLELVHQAGFGQQVDAIRGRDDGSGDADERDG